MKQLQEASIADKLRIAEAVINQVSIVTSNEKTDVNALYKALSCANMLVNDYIRKVK
jgi:hypothetical protein